MKWGKFILLAIPFLILYGVYCFLASQDFSEGQADYVNGDFAAAQEHFSRVTSIYILSLPSKLSAVKEYQAQLGLLDLAEQKRGQKEYQAAVAAYETFFEGEQGSGIGSGAELRVEDLAAQTYTEWIADLGQREEYARAVEQSLQMIELFPEHPDVAIVHAGLPALYVGWADILRQGLDYATAIEKYRIVQREFPESEQAKTIGEPIVVTSIAWGKALLDSGDYAAAAEKLESVLVEFKAKSLELAVPDQLGRITLEWSKHLMYKERFEEANEKITAYQKDFPDQASQLSIPKVHTEILLAWGKSLKEAGEFDAAISQYKQALLKYPTFAVLMNVESMMGQAYLEWGDALLADHQPNLAVHKYDAVLSQFSRTTYVPRAEEKLPVALLEWAAVLHQNNQFADEIDQLSRVLEEFSRRAEAEQAARSMVAAYDGWGKQLIESRSFLKAMQIYTDAGQFAQLPEEKELLKVGYEAALTALIDDSGKDGNAAIQDAFETACAGKPAEYPVFGVSKDELARGLSCSPTIFPEEWKATTPGNFKYVVEVTFATSDIESCAYTGGHFLVRRRKTAAVIVRSTATGQVISRTVLYGPAPIGCPNSYMFGSTTEYEYGGPVDTQTILNWLKSFFPK